VATLTLSLLYSRDELTRDDRIVDFYYPNLSCFGKIISVSDPNHVLVKIILSVSENYPKVYYNGQHSLHFCVVSILSHEAKQPLKFFCLLLNTIG